MTTPDLPTRLESLGFAPTMARDLAAGDRDVLFAHVLRAAETHAADTRDVRAALDRAGVESIVTYGSGARETFNGALSLAGRVEILHEARDRAVRECAALTARLERADETARLARANRMDGRNAA